VMFKEFLTTVSHGSLLNYIDGGTGSMLLQAAIAGVLSALYIAKGKLGQLKALISNRSNQKDPPQ
jgi:hypothetical protein